MSWMIDEYDICMKIFTNGTNTTVFAWHFCHGIQWWKKWGRHFSFHCVYFCNYLSLQHVWLGCTHNMIFVWGLLSLVISFRTIGHVHSGWKASLSLQNWAVFHCIFVVSSGPLVWSTPGLCTYYHLVQLSSFKLALFEWVDEWVSELVSEWVQAKS